MNLLISHTPKIYIYITAFIFPVILNVLLTFVFFTFPQFCQQVSAEGGGLLCSVRAVPEGNWDLRAGVYWMYFICVCHACTFLNGHWLCYFDFLYDIHISRLEPTQWTTHCWNTAPKSISSKPLSVISLSMSSMLRQVYIFVVHPQDLGWEVVIEF